ncbi:tumor necrosis factor ligand superfamily member 11 [Microcaecilia unicolor]|uniref:Tumor necrosis factor ligand superfamily member 11 n=1 Tax=Microcaecilia unicolor TaxID=1415580 RepID=A0A6P7XM37_9AMPH|nr:tumor necrosis factor ligand superfamily member 11 [Microcaecilia unicolor]
MSAGKYRSYLCGSAELGSDPRSPPPGSVPRSVLAALVLLGVAQVGCTLGLFFYFRTQMGPNRMLEEELQCLRRLLKLHHSSYLGDTAPDESKFVACSELKQAFQAAIEKEVHHYLKRIQPDLEEALAEEMWTIRKRRHEKWPIAHLTINLSNHTLGTQQKVDLLSWNYQEGWANILNMTYNHGKLKVSQDGFYYVYANICFRHHEASGNDDLRDTVLQLMVYVCKSNMKKKSSETLMKGGGTKVWSRNSPYYFYSVYQGGIFKLMADDEIFIQASNPSLLDPSQEASYYGAFKIRGLAP